ncbi:MAG: hypothetical protein HY402_03280 [Elusimicrobia bacterium]|nr:hypothetical protein [Elusimicrobiota bacterium]
MCGKCGSLVAKAGCGSLGLGTLLLVLTVATKLAHFSILGLGPRSFAVGSALLLLFSIALHTCKSACHIEGQ